LIALAQYLVKHAIKGHQLQISTSNNNGQSLGTVMGVDKHVLLTAFSSSERLIYFLPYQCRFLLRVMIDKVAQSTAAIDGG
jgi:hypothetical protein